MQKKLQILTFIVVTSLMKYALMGVDIGSNTDADLMPLDDIIAAPRSVMLNSICDPLATFEKKEPEKINKLKHKKHKELKEKKHSITIKQINKLDNTLDFEVENKTGKIVYVTCFAYMKKQALGRWRWNKSPVYSLNDNQKTIIKLPAIDDEQDRTNTYGYLAILKTQQEAEDATFELLSDNKKLELNLLAQLKGKKVVLEIEKYGMAPEFYDYDFVPKDGKDKAVVPSLNFAVENKTGKTIIITCFSFEKKAKGTWLAAKTTADWTSEEESRDDMTVWRFDKSPLVTLQPEQVGMIDIDKIVEKRDRSEVRGYLAIFDEDEQKKAEDSVYELLSAQNKLSLGKLVALNNKKVILNIEDYGIEDDLLDYKIKPISHIDFTKLDQVKITKKIGQTI